MARTMRGWTNTTSVDRVVQDIVNHKSVETLTRISLKANFQPMPARTVNRKPEEQRSWKWWSIIVVEGPFLETDEIFIRSGKRFRIMSGNDWTESGFQKYEAIEDYEVPST
jgi:hypothetical protein